MRSRNYIIYGISAVLVGLFFVGAAIAWYVNSAAQSEWTFTGTKKGLMVFIRPEPGSDWLEVKLTDPARTAASKYILTRVRYNDDLTKIEITDSTLYRVGEDEPIGTVRAKAGWREISRFPESDPMVGIRNYLLDNPDYR